MRLPEPHAASVHSEALCDAIPMTFHNIVHQRVEDKLHQKSEGRKLNGLHLFQRTHRDERTQGAGTPWVPGPGMARPQASSYLLHPPSAHQGEHSKRWIARGGTTESQSSMAGGVEEQQKKSKTHDHHRHINRAKAPTVRVAAAAVFVLPRPVSHVEDEF